MTSNTWYFTSSESRKQERCPGTRSQVIPEIIQRDTVFLIVKLFFKKIGTIINANDV